MLINLDNGYFAHWATGSHTINYFTPEGFCYECVTFGWEKDRPTQVEAMEVLVRHEEMIGGIR